MAIRYQVGGQPVTCRSESTAGPLSPPWISDYRVTIEPGALLPDDVPMEDIDRLLRAGRLRPVTR